MSDLPNLPKMQTELTAPQGDADSHVFAQVEKWMVTIREMAGEHQNGAATATMRLERLLASATE
jgi:hypothetical protein